MWALIFASLFHGAAYGAGDDENAELWLPLSEGVYWHKGKHKSLEEKGRDDIANSGLVIGDRCMAIIDAGGSVALGKRLLAAARALSDKPLCYVISTHIHFDHVLGSSAMDHGDTRHVGHHALPVSLAENAEFFSSNFAEELSGATVPEVAVLVDGTEVLDLGGRSLHLRSWPVAHTHSDLTVRDSLSDTLWTGDLVFRGRLPVVDGSLRGWVAVMRDLKMLSARIIVPGHGHTSDNWSEAMSAQDEYLSWLLKSVRGAVAEGMFLEDAVAGLEVPNSGQWEFAPAATHRRNITKAFIELEWE